MDLISVIVPVYKVEAYLDKCVQSIVDQTYRNLEIILVDDGSPDNCGAMCDAWAEKDSRIKVIHKENGGLSDARNAGMAAATGDYIGFVDSDDWIESQMYERLHEAMVTTDSDIAACGIQLVDEGQTLKITTSSGTVCCLTPDEAIGGLIQGGGVKAVAWNKLYRRNLLSEELFPVGKSHEDEFFTYRILAKAKKIAYIENELYYYLQRQGSIMQTFNFRRLDCLDAYWERLEFLRSNYPDLYRKDKLEFSIFCTIYYRQVLKLCKTDAQRYKKKIVQCRKKVRFSHKELKSASMKQRIYVYGTHWCIELFCRLLNWYNKGN